MEIRIDTTKDSKEDIRKAIRLLESLVDDDRAGAVQQQNFPTGENVLGSFFDTPDTAAGPGLGNSNSASTSSTKPVAREKVSIGNLDVY